MRKDSKRSTRIDVYYASPSLGSHHGNHSLHRDNRAQDIEMEYLIKQGRLYFFYAGCVAAPSVVNEAVDAAVVLVHSSNCFAHTIELRQVDGDGQAAGKLLGKFLERATRACQQGDLSACTRQSNCGRSPYSRRSARNDKHLIFDLHIEIDSAQRSASRSPRDENLSRC